MRSTTYHKKVKFNYKYQYLHEYKHFTYQWVRHLKIYKTFVIIKSLKNKSSNNKNT